MRCIIKLISIANKLGLKLLTKNPDKDTKVVGLYACDLLSWVMVNAKTEHLWFTVMGNVNSIALASLNNVSAIVLVEGAILDNDAKIKAEEHCITVYSTNLDCATALIKANELLNLNKAERY